MESPTGRIAAVKKATLFGVPGSHPSFAAELMLRRKGIDYRRVDLVAWVHRGVLRALRFPGITVPALRLEGKRVQGTRAIAVALDELRPDSPLVPADPAVTDAEKWGDDVYQPVPRRIVWNALRRDRSMLSSYLEGAKLGVPVPVAASLGAPVIRAAARANSATDANVRRDLAALPGMLDHVDDLLRTGVIGGAEPNVADYQIATSTALLATLDDLGPMLEGRPALDHARRLAPGYPGRTPKVFPRDWLQA
jgi:glutathione S-transferase